MECEKRIAYLDIIKTLAMFLVCYYHFQLSGDIAFSKNLSAMVVIRRLIMGMCSMGVPLFFMVAGAVFKKQDKNFNRCLKLLLGYMVWRFFTVIIISVYNRGIVDINYICLLKDIFLFKHESGVDTAHLWYIPCFISVYFIAQFGELGGGIKYFIIVIGCIYFLSNDITAFLMPAMVDEWYFNDAIIRFMPFQKDVGIMLLYFLWGNVLHRNKDKLERISMMVWIVLGTVGVNVLCIEWYIRSKIQEITWDSVFGGYGTFTTLCMTTGIFMICQNTDRLWRGKFFHNLFCLVGRNTLSVYYLHWIFGYTIMGQIQMALGIVGCEGILFNGMKSICMIICFSILGEVAKKFKILFIRCFLYKI